MCDQPGTTIIKLDRQTRQLRGYIVCGCGETEIKISIDPSNIPSFGIDYWPQPKLGEDGFYSDNRS